MGINLFKIILIEINLYLMGLYRIALIYLKLTRNVKEEYLKNKNTIINPCTHQHEHKKLNSNNN
jgi:hypothetical protein